MHEDRMSLMISTHGTKNVQRPSLYISPTKSFWSAITFEAPKSDPFDICHNNYEDVVLEISDSEAWKFFNARISLLGDKFVMIFERCERVSVNNDPAWESERDSVSELIDRLNLTRSGA